MRGKNHHGEGEETGCSREAVDHEIARNFELPTITPTI